MDINVVVKRFKTFILYSYFLRIKTLLFYVQSLQTFKIMWLIFQHKQNIIVNWEYPKNNS